MFRASNAECLADFSSISPNWTFKFFCEAELDLQILKPRGRSRRFIVSQLVGGPNVAAQGKNQKNGLALRVSTSLVNMIFTWCQHGFQGGSKVQRLQLVFEAYYTTIAEPTQCSSQASAVTQDAKIRTHWLPPAFRGIINDLKSKQIPAQVKHCGPPFEVSLNVLYINSCDGNLLRDGSKTGIRYGVLIWEAQRICMAYIGSMYGAKICKISESEWYLKKPQKKKRCCFVCDKWQLVT